MTIHEIYLFLFSYRFYKFKVKEKNSDCVFECINIKNLKKNADKNNFLYLNDMEKNWKKTGENA